MQQRQLYQRSKKQLHKPKFPIELSQAVADHRTQILNNLKDSFVVMQDYLNQPNRDEELYQIAYDLFNDAFNNAQDIGFTASDIFCFLNTWMEGQGNVG